MRTIKDTPCPFAICRWCTLGGLLLIIAACTQAHGARLTIGDHEYDPEQAVQLKLPKVLREISGLTFDDAGYLYGHNDEKGVIYQIDYAAGVVLKRFMLTGSVRADFEGIAFLNQRLYLISSSGVLFETRVGDAEERVPFLQLTDGLPCEVEGLSASPDGRSLLAACKNHNDGKNDIRIYRWAIGSEDWDVEPAVQISKSEWQKLMRGNGLKPPGKIQPTGLAKTPAGNLVLIAGRQHILMEFTLTSELVRSASIDPGRHRQAEGVAMSGQGELLIADEGDSKGNQKSRGVLTVHAPIR